MGKQLALLVVAVIIIVFAFGINVFPPRFTGYAIYSSTTIETNLVSGENGSGLNVGSNTSYWNAFLMLYDSGYHTIVEPAQGRTIWNYDFSTIYNDTQPALINLSLFGISGDQELFNISIYNYDTLSWDYLVATSVYWPTTAEISTVLSWQDMNLSHYVNGSDGAMMILLEDKDQSGSSNTLRIDYIDINVTVSPLSDDWMSLTNATNNSIANAENYTRTGSMVNASAHWNASSVSVVDGAFVVNDSNTGLVRTFNVSESPYSMGFDGNYTNFTMNFSNTSLFLVGGNYTVWMKGWDSFYQQNVSSERVWFGLTGHANVSNATHNESGGSIVQGMQVELACRVLDSNSSWQVDGYNISFYNDTGYVGANVTNASGWAVLDYTVTDVTSTITCNITDESGLYYLAGPENERNVSLLVTNDTSAPIVNSISLSYRGLATNKTSLYSNLNVVVNVTDNQTNATSITSVYISAAYPDSKTVTRLMTQNSTETDLWFIIFNTTNDDMPINATGIYGINITAYDLASNLGWADWTNAANTNFTGNSTLNVTLSGHIDNSTTYNRGEGLVLYARDVNGLIMSGVNWTVNITRYGEAEVSLAAADDASNRTYFILPNGSVGNWTIEVIDVSDSVYGANIGSRNFSFLVSKTIYPYFLNPLYPNRQFSISSSIAHTSIKASVNNSRDMPQTYNMSVNFSYPTGSVSKIFSQEGATGVYSNMSSSWSITAPASYSTNFQLKLNASDPYNNTGSTILTMRTASAPTNNDGNGGSSSSSGGSGIDTSTNCTCEWESVGCGPLFGNCTQGYEYQTLKCEPSGCRNDTRCFQTSICNLPTGFNMTSDATNIELPSGENATLKVTFANTGGTNISIQINVEKSCCSVPFAEKTITLTPESVKDVLLPLHARLLETPGFHNVTVTASIGSLEKSIAFNIRIFRNQLFDDIDALKSELDDIDARISEYKGTGLMTGGVESLSTQARQAISGAEMDIDNDRIENAISNKEAASLGVASVKNQMLFLEAQKFAFDNKWLLLLAVIVLVIVYYMTFQVMLPLRRLSKGVKSLATREKEMVKKRKEIEMQYFQGKISEQTFKEMLVKTQDTLLGTRGKSATSIDERRQLIRERLSPKGILKWVFGGPLRVARWASGRGSKKQGSSR
jgi:hypothetical protein